MEGTEGLLSGEVLETSLVLQAATSVAPDVPGVGVTAHSAMKPATKGVDNEPVSSASAEAVSMQGGAGAEAGATGLPVATTGAVQAATGLAASQSQPQRPPSHQFEGVLL